MSTQTETHELLTVKQAAALLQLDERTIRNHINRSRLRASKLPGGKGWLIRREDLFTALEPAAPQSGSRPGIVPAGTNPLSVETSGIIRRINTPEGRARAIAVLDRILAESRNEEPDASEQPPLTHTAIQFRRWNTETWEPLEEGN
ncbi:MAG: helix-turn-helix domain-containing protein [Janthinobacterium lividum]